MTVHPQLLALACAFQVSELEALAKDWETSLAVPTSTSTKTTSAQDAASASQNLSCHQPGSKEESPEGGEKGDLDLNHDDGGKLARGNGKPSVGMPGAKAANEALIQVL